MRGSIRTPLCALALSLTVQAQITFLTSTGCKGSPATLVIGQPRIGRELVLHGDRAPCSHRQTFAFVAFSAACAHTQPLPLGCSPSANPCGLLLPIDSLFLSLITAHIKIRIPNDHRFVGTTFCAQGGCFRYASGFCLSRANQIARIRIQP